MKSGSDIVLIFVDGKKHDLCPAMGGLQTLCHLQSIQQRHRYIGHENIRIESQNRVDGLTAIRHGINDFKVLGQDCTNLCHQCLMIIR